MARDRGRVTVERARARKAPSQSRAQDTVQVICTAARAILEEKGLEGLTTNHIAHRAGVSIGSLYQYFPSKEAIVGAVIERRAAETKRELLELTQDLPKTDLPAVVRAITAWYVERYRRDRKLYRALLPEIEQVRRYDYVRETTGRIAELIALGLEGRPGLTEVPDAKLAGQLIATAAEGILGRAVMAGDDVLDHPRLPEEVAVMMIGYLTQPRASAPAADD